MKYKKLLLFIFPVLGSVILPLSKAFTLYKSSKVTQLIQIFAYITFTAIFIAHLYVFYIKNTYVKNAEIIAAGAIPLITSTAISISNYRNLILSKIGIDYYVHMLLIFIYTIMLTQMNKRE